MIKYDFAFKLKVVKSYLNGEVGYRSLAKEYGFSDTKTTREWVNSYNTLGNEGLEIKNKRTFYTVQYTTLCFASL